MWFGYKLIVCGSTSAKGYSQVRDAVAVMESVHVSSPSFQTNPTRENCVIVLPTPSTVRLPVVAVRYGRVHDHLLVT